MGGLFQKILQSSFKHDGRGGIYRGMSTVFALSSGQGKCGVGVIRISGEAASTAITQMTRPATLPSPRQAVLRPILHPKTEEVLDRGLVLWFPGPGSFTGEDCVELQVHGGSAVLTALLQALGELPHLRPALPGEFTRRAFSNGKLDLTGVEGLADLINAETEAQRRQALRQCSGALGELYAGWRQLLLEARARIEAHIDFGEEGHEQIDDISSEVGERVLAVAEAMERHLRDGQKGEILRSGVRLAILGSPNVGKSSCLNMLLQRPAAIVSDVPGTTRDVVTGTLDVSGYPVLVQDTAGIRKTADPVEKQGVDRALNSAAEAHAALVLLDATSVMRALTRQLIDSFGDIEQVADEELLKIVQEEESLKKVERKAMGGDSWQKSKHFVNKVCVSTERLDAKLVRNTTAYQGNALRKITVGQYGNEITDSKAVFGKDTRIYDGRGITKDMNTVHDDMPVDILVNNIRKEDVGNIGNYSKGLAVFNKASFLEQHLNEISDDIADVKLSQMNWYLENNYIILINKIDLLQPYEVDLLNTIFGSSTFGNDDLRHETHICNKKSFSQLDRFEISSNTKNINDHSDTKNSNITSREAPIGTVIPVSLTEGTGSTVFLSSLKLLCRRLCSTASADELPSLTTTRHRTHINAALDALKMIIGEPETDWLPENESLTISAAAVNAYKIINEHRTVGLEDSKGIESVACGSGEDVNHSSLLARDETLVSAAHYLHQATRHLGHVTGHVTTEHVLDQIFKEFCIGK